MHDSEWYHERQEYQGDANDAPPEAPTCPECGGEFDNGECVGCGFPYRPTADLKAKLAAILDATMPGRREGSAAPEDLTPVAGACLARAGMPETFDLSGVRAFLAGKGERYDEPFALAFRRVAIREELRNTCVNPVDEESPPY